jgi:hypothetical protein
MDQSPSHKKVNLYFYSCLAFQICAKLLEVRQNGRHLLAASARLRQVALEATLLEFFQAKTRTQGIQSMWRNDRVGFARVARWYIFKPKIHDWVNFVVSCSGRCRYILCPFGLFNGTLVDFVANLYILLSFDTFFQKREKSGNPGWSKYTNILKHPGSFF